MLGSPSNTLYDKFPYHSWGKGKLCSLGAELKLKPDSSVMPIGESQTQGNSHNHGKEEEHKNKDQDYYQVKLELVEGSEGNG